MSRPMNLVPLLIAFIAGFMSVHAFGQCIVFGRDDAARSARRNSLALR